MANVKQQFLIGSDCYKYAKYITPRGIMVHSTAVPGIMATEWFDRWNKPDLDVAVHSFLDDSVVVQHLPWNMRAWHCGDSGNDTHIAFEICEPYDWDTNKSYFEKAWNNAVNLTVFLCKMYSLTARDVVSHSEGFKLGIASNHSDPMHWFPKFSRDMDMFRNDVDLMLNGPLKGDLNRDRKLSVSDIVELRKIIMDGKYDEFGDLDEDGKNTVVDIVALRRKIMQVDEQPKNPYKMPVEELSLGAKGNGVKWLQWQLNHKGYSVGRHGIDGSFGPDTDSATRLYQKGKGLKVDGIVGPITKASLIQ